MTDTGVRVEGARELRASLRKAGADLADLKAVNASVASMVASAAMAAAPRRTGRLAASVRGNRAVSTARISAGTAGIPYAGAIHWGWPSRNIEAQPFIADTAAALEDQWVKLYETGIADVINKIDGA